MNRILAFMGLFPSTVAIACSGNACGTGGSAGVTTLGTDAHRNSLNFPWSDGERIDSWRRMNRWFSNHLLTTATNGTTST